MIPVKVKAAAGGGMTMPPTTDWLGREQKRAARRLARVNRIAKRLAQMQAAKTYSASRARKALALLKRTDAQGR